MNLGEGQWQSFKLPFALHLVSLFGTMRYRDGFTFNKLTLHLVRRVDENGLSLSSSEERLAG